MKVLAYEFQIEDLHDLLRSYMEKELSWMFQGFWLRSDIYISNEIVIITNLSNVVKDYVGKSMDGGDKECILRWISYQKSSIALYYTKKSLSIDLHPTYGTETTKNIYHISWPPLFKIFKFASKQKRIQKQILYLVSSQMFLNKQHIHRTFYFDGKRESKHTL